MLRNQVADHRAGPEAAGISGLARPRLDHEEREPHDRGRRLGVAGGRRVQQCGRLIQDHRVRIGEHYPGERELLCLCAIQILIVSTDDGVEVFHPVRADGIKRREQLGVGRFRDAVRAGHDVGIVCDSSTGGSFEDDIIAKAANGVALATR